MTTIIYQAIIDKKRKNCRIMIRLLDGIQPRNRFI